MEGYSTSDEGVVDLVGEFMGDETGGEDNAGNSAIPPDRSGTLSCRSPISRRGI